MSENQPINVVGAGLAGCMAALLLSNQGESVRLIENRPDIRVATQSFKDDVIGHLGKLVQSNKRSVNLALSHRGIEALKKAGVYDAIEPRLIPMHGRVIHSVNSTITYQPYGHDDQSIYSISRNDLNCLLLDRLASKPNVELLFESKIQSVKPDGSIVTTKGDVLSGKFTIGADGAFSSVRESMRRSMRMDFSMEYISAGYKELHIPPVNGDFALSNPEGLHIWPRHDFMLIALPNPDKSFTCTLFAPFEIMESVQTPEQIKQFFTTNFPDAVPLMPTMVEDYQSSPSSALLTVKCSPWIMANRVVLVGDAAHATVPFYGQGMNAAFEDCLFLTELYEQNKHDVEVTLREFNDRRVMAGQALCDLSLANFKEMSSKTASSWFLIKKKVEGVLNRIMPNTWIPLYTMVAFTRIPYDQAKERAARNEKILNTMGYLTAGTLLAGATAGAWFASKKYQFK